MGMSAGGGYFDGPGGGEMNGKKNRSSVLEYAFNLLMLSICLGAAGYLMLVMVLNWDITERVMDTIVLGSAFGWMYGAKAYLDDTIKSRRNL